MENDPVAVFQAADAIEAYLVSDLLLEEGIDAKVVGDSQPFAGLTAAMSVDVLVPQEDQIRAAEIVAKYQDNQNEVSKRVTWICQSCGETSPPTFDTCFECGADRPVLSPTALPQEAPTGTAAIDLRSDEKSPGPESSQCPTQPAKRAIWFEMAVVLSFVATFYFTPIASLVWPETFRVRGWSLGESLWLIVHSMQTGFVVAYLMWSSEKAWSDFGLGRPRMTLDVPLACCIVFVDYTLWTLLAATTVSLGIPPSSESTVGPVGLLGHAVFVVAVCVAAFSEELILRGYLIPRFEELFQSTVKSVLLTTLIFAGYHIYQGPMGILSAGMGGLVYGISFCVLRRLWPVAVAHAVFNMLGGW